MRKIDVNTDVKICLNCGINFTKKYSVSKNNWRKRKYCTLICAMTSVDVKKQISLANKGKYIGSKNYFWKGGIVPADPIRKKEYKSDYNFEKLYGISAKKKKEKYDIQGGKCVFFEICGNKLPGDWRKAIQDHEHSTGVIRGLLCNACNVAMVGIDNERWLHKALEYRNFYKKNES